MKYAVTLVMILLAVITLGCRDGAPPKTETRVETASEAARNDYRAIAERLAQQKSVVDEAFERERARVERQRYFDALRVVSMRWTAGVDEASRTARSDLAATIKKLQAIQAETSTVDVNDCTIAARATLQSAMAASIEALSRFQKETGDGSDATAQKAQQGAELLRAAQQEMDACLIK